MAEFDPDAFLKKYGDLSTDPPAYPYEAWDKFGTGVGRGFAGTAAAVLPYLPTSPIMPKEYDPLKGMREYGEGGATEGPEAAGKIAGEIAPTLLVPETGIGSLAARGLLRGGMVAAPRVALGAGRVAEAGAQGAVGGIMAPGQDKTSNAATGAAAGGAVGAGEEVVRMIPPKYRWLLSLVPGAVAVEILHRMGAISAWTSYPAVAGLGSGLGALAASAAGRIPKATVGATAARIRQDSTDGR
jgi:hypothetical protein